MWHAFIFLLTLLIRLLRAACNPMDELLLENLALRQQVAALMLVKHRPKLHDADRAFWIALRGTWSKWTTRLVVVRPETVVDWQRRRFRRYWTEDLVAAHASWPSASRSRDPRPHSSDGPREPLGCSSDLQ